MRRRTIPGHKRVHERSWLRDIAISVAGSVVFAGLVWIGGRAIFAARADTRPNPSRHGGTGGSGQLPIRIEGVTPLSDLLGGSLALANSVQLTAQQLAQANNQLLTGHYDSYLPPALDPVPIQVAVTNVTIVGNETQTVTINSMQVIKHCEAPLSGSLFSNPSQGINGTIGLGFDLDSTISYAQNREQYRPLSGNFFQKHVVTLRPGESQTLSIQVQTNLHYCQFTFQISVATRNGLVAEKIDDNGRPFQLTGMASAYQAVYVGGIGSPDRNGAFVQVDPKTYRG
jgi:hypothetical protein